MNRQQWWKENVLIWKDGWPSLWDEAPLLEDAIERGWPELAEDALNYFSENRYKTMLNLQDDLLGF